MFQLAQPQPDGQTRRAHLEAAARHSALARAELEPPPFPAAGAEIWTDFLRLSGGRRSGGFGEDRLAWLDVDAYARLYGARFSAWELDVLKDLDTAYFAARPAVAPAALPAVPAAVQTSAPAVPPRPRGRR